MVKIYTKTGDSGETSLGDGTRVSKDSPHIHAVGLCDELQSSLDQARLYLADNHPEHLSFINTIQDRLRILVGGFVGVSVKDVTSDEIDVFEAFVEKHAAAIPPKFVRFNNPASVFLNESRVRCRAFERSLVQFKDSGVASPLFFAYINRLSDVLFVLSHLVDSHMKKNETLDSL